MKLQSFVATALSLLGALVASPSFAQDSSPPDSKPPQSEKGPTDQPTTPSTSPDAPNAPQMAPPSDQMPPAPPPSQEGPPGPPTPDGTIPGTPGTISSDAASAATQIDGFESFPQPPRDEAPSPIGEKLAPLLLTAGFGYGYAAIKHPDLESTGLDGSFMELTGGTELTHEFRLSFSLTSFQTTIHRTPSAKWAEGNYPVTQAGLRSQADPVEPTHSGGGDGGVEVQKTLHVHSLGPRLDFLPLGKQGPYIGLTAGLGVIQDIGLRAGGDVGLRVGGEWRPYHVFGIGVEAGAHGQLYTDSKAAIPYATARLQFYLDPEQFSSKRFPTVRTFVPTQQPTQQRTLPIGGPS